MLVMYSLELNMAFGIDLVGALSLWRSLDCIFSIKGQVLRTVLYHISDPYKKYDL